MSEEHFPQKEIIEENNENIQQINQNSTANPQNLEIEKNNLENNQEKKEELKLGQYILTPLQSILLNKKMPFGIKLETEENILKSMETAKNQSKKNKISAKHKERFGRERNNYGGIIKKRNQNIDNKESIVNNFNKEEEDDNIIFKKCKKCLEKIKDFKYAKKYYQSDNPDIPCLAEIEKKLKNNEYKGIYDFQMDGRKIWNYYFKMRQDTEITSKMSDEWEKICSELDNQNQKSEIGVDSIKKRTNQIQKEYNEYKINNALKGNLPAPIKKITPNNEHNKPMTVEEKNQLGNNIRSLNKDQLKGIIKILSENNPAPKSKYFEFDIDQLSTKKLRELEKYVKECLASNTKSNKNLSSNSNNSTNNKNININNKNMNQKENQNNKNNNKGNNISPQDPTVLKSNSKNENKDLENKGDESAKKNIQSNKKTEKKNDSFSDSNSMSSDSSLSS